MPSTLLDLQERLRASNEQLLQLKLDHATAVKAHAAAVLAQQRKTFKLEQALTSLRWWAVAHLVWMVLEILEPARYAFYYPTSWAFKLATLSAHPLLLVGWFAACAAMVAPLIFFLAFAPSARWYRPSQDLGMYGLALGAVGFGFLTSSAMRLDVAHLVDSYLRSTAMLASTSLLVACWHNSRMVREYWDSLLGRNSPCVEPAR